VPEEHPDGYRQDRPLAARLRRISKSVSRVFYRLPIRTRLAAASALLTLVILCAFAVVVGSLTVERLRSEFNSQFEATADRLPNQLRVLVSPGFPHSFLGTNPNLGELASFIGGKPVIRVINETTGEVLAETPHHAPYLGTIHALPLDEEAHVVHGYRVANRRGVAVVETNEGAERQLGTVYVQFAQPLAPLNANVARVELLLLLGVLGGAALSLLFGVMIARRAMAPIAQLTSTAAEIARTRDASRSMPESVADDEVAELGRTLAGMLRELESAHAETEATLARQRQFVADASHELRTPLTSILANLELLADTLGGDQGEAARSALRSSQRMRRLVADLLLLARSDVGRVLPREPLDLAQVVVEAAAEMEPMSAGYEIVVDAHSAPVKGVRDELHRMTINLIENALRHTPAGTEVQVRTDTTPDGWARLVVQDSGPGVPEGMRETLFERFVRGAGDRGGSFGLGLAIVKAVAESDGGSVTVEDTYPYGGEHRGARFVVLLPPATSAPAPEPLGQETHSAA
jgi:signal transduction histidine kinase